jgi:E1A/CREB-binding protein
VFCLQNTTLEDALPYVEAGGPIYIRQVTSMERKLEVRELMRARYAHKNYPEEFPFRCKCIVVFQELDGVDVILFALYVYEHGADNPPPNQRVVYISYLDSVHFMRPRTMRTFVYHEILISYLDYARRRGFATAHIWACPPLKGDDYIFFAKPEDQKTPRDSRLRQWYIDMLTDCQKRNIVGKVTNMYDLYFANESLDATVVPYLEGDYFPGEAENIIKMLSEVGGKKGGGTGKKKKSKATNKSKGNTGTRSTGMDEQALLDSGILNLKDLDRDQVMVKLGETIQPMKESFIVAFLNWSGAKEDDMVVPKEIEEARVEYEATVKDDTDLVGNKRDPSGCVKDLIASGIVDRNGKEVKVIDDDAEDMDCEILNNRQAFLNLCRGNHYQFDEVRRAKHTSIMVLWHLHNRDAPKFVQQCFACSREILSGKRYHCNTCAEFDLCQVCFDDPNASRGSCTHELVPIAVDPDASKERSNLTEDERKQRQRNVMLHIQLIEHAARCQLKNCPSRNCPKMKDVLRHANTCAVKVQGGCKTCKKIWTLLRIHAQKCKDPSCEVPQCLAIKDKMRQLQKQQQAMDDRRRIEMNRHMRFGKAGGTQ